MRRRNFLLASLCAAAVAPDALAQTHPGPARLAILSPDTAASADPASGSSLSIFLQAMHQLGHGEGGNLVTEFRFAGDRLDRLPALAAELVAWRPDVIYTYTGGGADAAAEATKTIPIVVGVAGEPVLLALAGNLSRPVGNVTGITLESIGQYEKCLQLLKETAPRIVRVGVLVNPGNPSWDEYPAILKPAADRLGLVLARAESRGSADIDRSLAALGSEKLDALLVGNDSTLLSGDGSVRDRIIGLARDRHLPSASTSSGYAGHGGLLSLGADQRYLRQRAADYVHRIILGARPGDLPVERPTKFKLTVNLQTAKAIGVTIPPAIVARADEVIE